MKRLNNNGFTPHRLNIYNNNLRQAKKGEGFTLMELMITFSVIILLATIAVPLYHSISDGVALDNQSAQLINDLRKAQRKSVTSQDFTKHGVHFDSSSYTLFGGDSWTSPTYTEVKPLLNGITVTGGGGSDIIFSRLAATTTAQQITISLPSGKEKIIEITGSGGIYSL